MSDPTLFQNAVEGTGPGWGTLSAQMEKQALRHAQPVLVLSMGAKKFSLPTNSTKTLRLRRAVPYAAATTALTEGVPPTATDIEYVQIDVALKQYGAFVRITDQVVDLQQTPILSDINQLNAEQAAKTKEALLWGMLQGSGITYWAGGESTESVSGVMDYDIQGRAVRTLNNNKAKRFTSIVTGGVKVGTMPVEASYICFTHTDAEKDIRQMEGFVPVAKYGSQKPLCEQELGTVDSVRYILSPDLTAMDAAGVDASTAPTLISKDGSNVDVYTSVFVGMDAYGTLNLAGKGVFTPVVVPVGSASASDPLGQQGSVGWKLYSAETILNSDWIVIVEHGATD